MNDQKITARELIRRALKTSQIIGIGEKPTAEEAEDALVILNGIISSWNNEDMFFSFYAEQMIDLDGTGEFKIDNPSLYIKNIYHIQNTGPTTELKQVSMEAYQLWDEPKAVRPTLFYCDNNPGQNTIYLNSKSSSGKVKIITSGSFNFFSSLDSEVFLPMGFVTCLHYTLSVLLCPEYNRNPSEVIAGKALNYKANLKMTMQEKKQEVFVSDYPGCGMGYRYDIWRD